jgi:hypothetical protein
VSGGSRDAIGIRTRGLFLLDSWARGGLANPQIQHRKYEIFLIRHSYLKGDFPADDSADEFFKKHVRMGNAADLTFNTDSVGVEEHHRRLKKRH